MPDPSAVVNAFLTGMGTSTADMIANYRACLVEDIEWHTGTDLCVGIEECVAALERAAPYDVAYWNVTIKHELSNGRIVFNERVDHIFRPDGSHLADTYVCAIFEVEGDRIVKWRDYYDPTDLRKLLAGWQAAAAS